MTHDPTIKIYDQAKKDFVFFLGQLAQFYRTLGDLEESKKYLKLQKAIVSGKAKL